LSLFLVRKNVLQAELRHACPSKFVKKITTKDKYAMESSDYIHRLGLWAAMPLRVHQQRYYAVVMHWLASTTVWLADAFSLFRGIFMVPLLVCRSGS
jgi:hypothetical protein